MKTPGKKIHAIDMDAPHRTLCGVQTVLYRGDVQFMPNDYSRHANGIFDVVNCKNCLKVMEKKPHRIHRLLAIGPGYLLGAGRMNFLEHQQKMRQTLPKIVKSFHLAGQIYQVFNTDTVKVRNPGEEGYEDEFNVEGDVLELLQYIKDGEEACLDGMFDPNEHLPLGWGRK